MGVTTVKLFSEYYFVVIVYVCFIQIPGLINATGVIQTSLQLGFEGDILKSTVSTHDKKVVCVFDSWSNFRTDPFQISNIDPTLCTQILYRTARVDNTTFQMTLQDSQFVDGVKWQRSLVSLAEDNPKLKILVSVGGWSEGGSKFTQIAADYRKRHVFVESVVMILKRYKFHGLDFAWHAPGISSHGGTSVDKEILPLLLKDLRKALRHKLLTITVPGNLHYANTGFNLQVISNFVDQFNIKTFDFTGGWDIKAYHQSALVDKDPNYSVEKSVKWYISNGAPAHKLVIGIPTYGRTFLLSETGDDGIGLGQSSVGHFGGDWVNSTTLLSYREICHVLKKDNESGEHVWKTFMDQDRYAPFARNGNRWISFDNPTSVEAKVRFLVTTKVKGALVWSIDLDDYKGDSCTNSLQQSISYPLLRTINAIFSNMPTTKSCSTTVWICNICHFVLATFYILNV